MRRRACCLGGHPAGRGALAPGRCLRGGADARHRDWQGRAGLQRGAAFDALRGGHRLDTKDGREIGIHLEQPPRTMAGHRHIVFLIGRGRGGIDHARIGQRLVLAHTTLLLHTADTDFNIIANCAFIRIEWRYFHKG